MMGGGLGGQKRGAAAGCAIVIALVCGVPLGARAQSVTAASEAQQLVERGIELRRGGDDASALELFQRAEQLAPSSVRVQAHLAATHQALGNWEAADRYLGLALRDPSDPYVQKHEAVLAEARRKIDSEIATLNVRGGPAGAQVRLNGRLLGTLPLDQPIRIKAGIYSMEVRLNGHYPAVRSVALPGGASSTESVTLEPRVSTPEAAPAPPFADSGPVASRRTNWATWTFAGLAAASGVGTAVAWYTREDHAERWNDDSVCLAPGLTREQVCGSERDDGELAGTLMWVGAAATAAFTTGAILSYVLSDESAPKKETALHCGVGLGQVSCAGTF